MGTPIKWPRTPSSLKVSSLKSSSGAIVQVPSSGTIVQVPSSGTKFRHHSSGAKFRHQVQVPSSDAKFRCQCFWILARPDPVKLEGNPSWNYFPPLPPNYQNPITINLGPVLCKVSWMFEFSIFCTVFEFVDHKWDLYTMHLSEFPSNSWAWRRWERWRTFKGRFQEWQLSRSWLFPRRIWWEGSPFLFVCTFAEIIVDVQVPQNGSYRAENR